MVLGAYQLMENIHHFSLVIVESDKAKTSLLYYFLYI